MTPISHTGNAQLRLIMLVGNDMQSNKLKVKFRFIAPFLLYLFVFLLWFSRWQHAPDSPSARLLLTGGKGRKFRRLAAEGLLSVKLCASPRARAARGGVHEAPSRGAAAIASSSMA